MNYFISIDADGNITSQYSGSDQLQAPWLKITQAQYTVIVPGCTWFESDVVQPVARILTLQQQLAQRAQALIAAGLAVTSSGTPNLNGIYGTDSRAQANMLGVVSYINANGKFPGSADTLTWYDSANVAHIFPSTTEFMALYTAGLDFVMDCQLIADSGTGTLPDATVTIP